MKTITFAIPCYNSESYMSKCVESLLIGGDDVEIIIVNDGSKDRTAEIADSFAEKYPTIVRAIHKENGGHGSAVNTGISNATGIFFKVVDSDDWADPISYMKVLKFLKSVIAEDKNLDMLVFNYVYEKVGAKHKKVMRPSGLPKDKFFTWEDVGYIQKAHYILMHSIVYRTQLIRNCGLKLPEHTFYVDNIYAFQPLPYIKDMYYMDVPFYRYFIGREDQSVNEKVMISRIDQQMRVNRIMVDIFTKADFPHEKCRKYMKNYLEIITTISFTFLTLAGTVESESKKKQLWRDIDSIDHNIYRYLRKSFLIRASGLPGFAGRKLVRSIYRIAKMIYGFN